MDTASPFTVRVANRELERDIENFLDREEYHYEKQGGHPALAHFLLFTQEDYSSVQHAFAERIAFYNSAQIKARTLSRLHKR